MRGTGGYNPRMKSKRGGLRRRAWNELAGMQPARIGVSDQTAILLGRAGALLHLAMLPGDFDLGAARHIPFPDALDLLVVNSHTRRTLSGAQRLRYSLNRFA